MTVPSGDRAHESAGCTPPGRSASATRPPSLASTVLALQRNAGNAAVGSLVSARRELQRARGKKKKTPAPAAAAAAVPTITPPLPATTPVATVTPPVPVVTTPVTATTATVPAYTGPTLGTWKPGATLGFELQSFYVLRSKQKFDLSLPK